MIDFIISFVLNGFILTLSLWISMKLMMDNSDFIVALIIAAVATLIFITVWPLIDPPFWISLPMRMVVLSILIGLLANTGFSFETFATAIISICASIFIGSVLLVNLI